MATTYSNYQIYYNGDLIYSSPDRHSIDAYALALMKQAIEGVFYDAYFTMQSDIGKSLVLENDDVIDIFKLLNNKNDIGDDYINIHLYVNNSHDSSCYCHNSVMASNDHDKETWWQLSFQEPDGARLMMTTGNCSGVNLKYKLSDTVVILSIRYNEELLRWFTHWPKDCMMSCPKLLIGDIATPSQIMASVVPYTPEMHIVDAMKHVNLMQAPFISENQLSNAMKHELSGRFIVQQEQPLTITQQLMTGDVAVWYVGRVDLTIYHSITSQPIAFIELKRSNKSPISKTTDIVVSGRAQLSGYVTNTSGLMKPLSAYLCVFNPGSVYIETQYDGKESVVISGN
jgi:hypothetical protein